VVVSPWAKANFVDHTRTDQSSVTRFVEDNWRLPPINGSFANTAGSINNPFDFRRSEEPNRRLLLDPTTGQPTHDHDSGDG
jgi:phospholipase C